jgi:Helix-turn-helix domain
MPTPWRDRVWQEFRAGNLTRAARDVLLVLRTYRSAGGTAWPSHAALADRVRCGARTVRRALAAAQRLGLVDWCERRVRSGWRWLRTSNLYRFLLPETPVATGGHRGREGENKKKKGALENWLLEVSRLPDLLAARRVAMAQRLAGAT